MDPYYSNQSLTSSWNISFPPVALLAYESSYASFSSFSDLSHPSVQPPVKLNFLETQNSNRCPTTSAIQCSSSPPETPLAYKSDLSYPFDQPPVDPNVLGNQNTFPPPVVPPVYESNRSPLSPLNDLSDSLAQPPGNLNVLETHNSNRCPTTSGIQSSFSPPVAPSAYESDLSYPFAQPPVDSNVLGNQNLYNPTTFGIQCLWETNGIICNHWNCSPEEMATHLSSIHMPKGMKVCHWKSCDRQGKMFRDRSQLVRHLRVHTGETPFKCDECEKQFASAGNYTIHKRTHTGEKPFLCPVDGCSKHFTSSTGLLVHKKSHLDPTPFHCKECDRKYSSPASLGRHIKNQHTKMATVSNNSGESLLGAVSVFESPAPAHSNIGNNLFFTQTSDFYSYPYGDFGHGPM